MGGPKKTEQGRTISEENVEGRWKAWGKNGKKGRTPFILSILPGPVPAVRFISG